MSHGGGDGGVEQLLMLPSRELGLAVIVLTAMPHENAGGLESGGVGFANRRGAIPLGQTDDGGEVEFLQAALLNDGIQRGGKEIHRGSQLMDQAVIAEPLAHVVIQLGKGLAVGHPDLRHSIAAFSRLGGLPHGEVDQLEEVEQDVGVIGVGVLPLPHELPPVEIPPLGAAVQLGVLGEIGEEGDLLGGFRGLHAVVAEGILHEAVEVVVARLPAVDLDAVEQDTVGAVLPQRLGGLALAPLVGGNVAGGLGLPLDSGTGIGIRIRVGRGRGLGRGHGTAILPRAWGASLLPGKNRQGGSGHRRGGFGK